MTSQLTLKRLSNEIINLNKNRTNVAHAIQNENNILQFYFMLRPLEEPYKDGLYLGIIDLPLEYPKKPGKFKILTPNGRYDIDKYICITLTSYHSDLWSPTWTIDKMILGILSIMLSNEKDDHGLNHLKDSYDKRKLFSILSHDYNTKYYKDIILQFEQFIKPDCTKRTQEEIDEFVEQINNKNKIIKRKDENKAFLDYIEQIKKMTINNFDLELLNKKI